MFNVELVKGRLKGFGIEAGENDEFALVFCTEKVRDTIKNEINHPDVPEGLEHIAADMAVGEYLMAKRRSPRMRLMELISGMRSSSCRPVIPIRCLL